ncbi:MAG: 50S ribosomal protein L32 [Acidobacteriota bacterium]
MGVPKRRHSKARKNMRRSEWSKMASPALVECPQCHELKMPHHVCLKCGFYKGKEVIS